MLLKQLIISSNLKCCRAFTCSSIVGTKQWRMDRGLPVNKNVEGVLCDGPDFHYLDGRPTPLLHKQKVRMLKQQNFATKIVQLCAEQDFAKERYKKMQKTKEEQRQRIINNRLKPKGDASLEKK